MPSELPPPATIYLQWPEGDHDCMGEAFTGATWASDRVNPEDVEYVRAEEVARLTRERDEAREQLAAEERGRQADADATRRQNEAYLAVQKELRADRDEAKASLSKANADRDAARAELAELRGRLPKTADGRCLLADEGEPIFAMRHDGMIVEVGHWSLYPPTEEGGPEWWVMHDHEHDDTYMLSECFTTGEAAAEAAAAKGGGEG